MVLWGHCTKSVFSWQWWYFFFFFKVLSSYHLCSCDVFVQAIGPELTFYNTSKDVGDSQILSNQLLHAQLDAFCRSVLWGLFHALKLLFWSFEVLNDKSLWELVVLVSFCLKLSSACKCECWSHLPILLRY